MTKYPLPTDPVSALSRPDGTTEGHEIDHGRLIGFWENVKHHGAKGDGVKDDSAAIQDAIDTGGTVFFPAGDYRLATPLHATYTNMIYRGSGHMFRSRLIPMGSNHAIFDASLSNGVNSCQFIDLCFSDRNHGDTYTTDGGDVAFQGGATSNLISNNSFTRCSFVGLKWAFDLKGTETYGNTGFLINNLYHCRFRSSPSRFNTASFVNDNHWIGCEWTAIEKGVPAVAIGPLHSAVTDGGNEAEGNWFDDCYFESCDRQAIVFRRAIGGVRGTYFEAIGDPGVTYTTKDGRTSALPTIDMQQKSYIRLENNFSINFITNAILWGNTDVTSIDQASFDLVTDWVGLGTDGKHWYDASNIYRVTPSVVGDATTRGGGTTVPPTGPGTVLRNAYPNGPWDISGADYTFRFDALWADRFEISCDGGGAPGDGNNVIIAKPTGATRGRRILFTFVTSEQNYNFGTITFASAFCTTGAFTPPSVGGAANGFARHIEFVFDGSHWQELFRSTADVTVPYAVP